MRPHAINEDITGIYWSVMGIRNDIREITGESVNSIEASLLYEAPQILKHWVLQGPLDLEALGQLAPCHLTVALGIIEIHECFMHINEDIVEIRGGSVEILNDIREIS